MSFRAPRRSGEGNRFRRMAGSYLPARPGRSGGPACCNADQGRRAGNPEEMFAEPVTFPVECYSQGETHDISQRAHDPLALLAYLDRFTNVADDLEEENELIANIAELQKEAEKTRGIIDTIPKAEADLKFVQGQIKAINDAKGKEVIDLQRVVAQEKTIRANIIAKANAINTAASRAGTQGGHCFYPERGRPEEPEGRDYRVHNNRQFADQV